MARTPTSSKLDKQRAKSRHQRLLTRFLVGDGSDLVWVAVHQTVAELFEGRRDVLEEYVRTEGHTDWVWLEESLSAAIDTYVVPELEQAPSEGEQRAIYEVAFILATQVIRARYPRVLPPTWIDTSYAALRGTAFDRDLAATARDAFLAGRDQEALDILAPLTEGPFLVFAEGFFQDRDAYPARENRILPRLPAGTTFATFDVDAQGAMGTEIEDGLDIDSAIGLAVRGFAQLPTRTFVVQVNGLASSPLVDRYVLASSPWVDRYVFAISNNLTTAETMIAAPRR